MWTPQPRDSRPRTTITLNMMVVQLMWLSMLNIWPMGIQVPLVSALAGRVQDSLRRSVCLNLRYIPCDVNVQE